MAEQRQEQSLNGTKTLRNLRSAMVNESLARTRYSAYAHAARAMGREELARALERMALNEFTHATFWMEKLNGPVRDLAEVFQSSAETELREWQTMYPTFAQAAREEGFEDIATMFDRVARIEKDHERQFMEMIKSLKSGPAQPAPKKEKRTGYRCVFCGAVFDERPDVCNVCHAIGSFEVYEYEADA